MVNIYKTLISLITFSIIYIIYFKQNAIFSYNDAYAYIGYARSLINFDELFDITLLPNIPISRAQQLGIVYFGYYPLMLLGLSDRMSFFILQTASIFNAIFILYLFNKLIEKFIGKFSSSIIILILLINFNYWAYFSAPINDGFFITVLLISFLYLEKTINKSLICYKDLLIVFFLTIFGMQFRIQFLCLNIALIIILVIDKKFLDSAKFIIITSFAVLFSILFGFFLTPSSAASPSEIAVITKSLSYDPKFYLSLIYSVGDLALIPMIIGNSYFVGTDSIFYKIAVFFSITLVFFGVLVGLNYSKYIKLIALFCFFTLGLLFLSPVYIDRYIYIILPFILVFYCLLAPRYKNYLLIIFFLFLFLVNSYRFFIYPPLVSINISSNILLDCLSKYDYELMSEDTRFTYFDTNGKASISKFTNSLGLKVSYGIVATESVELSESGAYRVNRLYKRQFGRLINYSYTVHNAVNESFLKCIGVSPNTR